MAWAPFDDGFHSHPKVVRLFERTSPLRALGLWSLALSWAAKNLTDGFISEGAARHLGGEEALDAAAELVRVGLWDEVETGGWLIHDYLEYNPSREEVLEKRAAAKERMRGVRERRKRSRDVRANNKRTARELPAKFNKRSREVSESSPYPTPNSVNREREEEDLHRPPPPPLSDPERARATVGAAAAVEELRPQGRRGGPGLRFIRLLQTANVPLAQHSYGAFREQWDWMATRPANEQAAVAQTLARDPWVTQHWRRTKPDHVQRHWHVYANGELPASPQAAARGPVRAMAREQFSETANPDWSRTAK